MSNYENISSLDLSLLRKYISKTLSKEESAQLQVFLSKHPEYNELFQDLTLADLQKIEQVSKSAKLAVQQQMNAGKKKGYAWMAAAVAVLVAASVWYQIDKAGSLNNDDMANEEQSQPELIALDSSVISPASYQKEFLVDTFYYVNTDEDIPEIAIEYIEENLEEVPVYHELAKDPIVHADTSIAPDAVETNQITGKETNEVLFAFDASLDYRQSVAVESDYASAYKVGQTKSFAGPIGGYEYDPNGMPIYGSSEEEFYTYLEEQLSADTLLMKIEKKMEAKVSFEVDHKGNVEKVNVVKCNHKQLCLKLTEIFEQFPAWQPADFKGKKGSVHYVIQVNYE